jgi:farnesyl-diphosphate farnesyltransferase
LFCYYSKEIAKNQEKLLELSSSFGQGLQMTNILKDIWDDQKRDVCWLPRDIFRKKGMKLNKINALSSSIQYQECIRQLVGLAHAHLENALHYTLLIPKEETGIRKFCLWAIGMAMLTLRKINSNLSFTDSRQVKITRNSVRATVLISNITVKSNMLLKIIFKQLGHGLPKDQF